MTLSGLGGLSSVYITKNKEPRKIRITIPKNLKEMMDNWWKHNISTSLSKVNKLNPNEFKTLFLRLTVLANINNANIDFPDKWEEIDEDEWLSKNLNKIKDKTGIQIWLLTA